MKEESDPQNSREELTIWEMATETMAQPGDVDHPHAKAIQEVLSKLEVNLKKENNFAPEDALNYNGGKVDTNPFHKLAKYIGRHEDVFLFIAQLRDKQERQKILDVISEKCGDTETGQEMIRQIVKKMEVYLKRIEGGGVDTHDFFLLEEVEGLQAFFNGYHIDNADHARNIHENLNVNVTKAGKVLETSQLFKRSTTKMTQEKSQLGRLKIYGNGRRVMTIEKNAEGQRNYVHTKMATMSLGIVWNDHTKGLGCSIVLGIKNGRLSLKKVAIEGDAFAANVSILELAKENKQVLIRGKTLSQVLHKLLSPKKQDKDAASKIAVSGKDVVESREVLIPGKISPEVITPSKVESVLENFKKLDSSTGPFRPDDYLNFNDGRECNHFNKIAKIYGRSDDPFLFNYVVTHKEHLDRVQKIMNDKYSGDEEKMKEFMKNLKRYQKRVENGKEDAHHLIQSGTSDVEAFTHGNYQARNGAPRNIHRNLNINLKNEAGSLTIGDMFTKKFQRMTKEGGAVERVKIYENGRRILNVIKLGNGARNYVFSRNSGKMDLKIEWDGNGHTYGLSVTVEAGRVIAVEEAVIDGALVEPRDMLHPAKENDAFFLGHRSLREVLCNFFKVDNQVIKKAPVGIASEKLTIVKICHGLSGKLEKDNPTLVDLKDDVSKLNFTKDLMQNEDDVGGKINQFDKLHKVWGRTKDIFLFVAALKDEKEREEILKIVERKCGEDNKSKEKFRKRMNISLDRFFEGELDAKEFLGQVEQDKHQVDAFFAGYHVANDDNPRNIHANLNINLDKEGRVLHTSQYFDHRIPKMDEEMSDLLRVKIFGRGQRIMTILKMPDGKRNYTPTKLAEVNLDIQWKVKDEAGTHNCAALMLIKKNEAFLDKALIDGSPVERGGIVELAKQNKQFLFKMKTLYELLKPMPKHAEIVPPPPEDEFVVLHDADFTNEAHDDAEKKKDGDYSVDDDVMGDW